jgi:hypothetical protein
VIIDGGSSSVVEFNVPKRFLAVTFKEKQLMKNQYFIQTKEELFTTFNQIHQSFEEMKNVPAQFWELSLSSAQDSLAIKDHLQQIDLVNESIIKSIKEVTAGIYDGRINNPRLYKESDLQVVDVLVNIYTQFQSKSFSKPTLDITPLRARVADQLSELHSFIEHFPEDLATNIKVRPKVISKVALDYYQLIYLAFTHMQLHTSSMLLIKDVLKLTSKQLPKTQVNKER